MKLVYLVILLFTNDVFAQPPQAAPLDPTDAEAIIAKISDEDFQAAVLAQFNDEYVQDMIQLAATGAAAGGDGGDIAELEGLRKRAECRRLQLGVRRFVRAAMRTIFFVNIEALDDLYEEYKEVTSDGIFRRFFNRSRSRRAFRRFYRVALRALRANLKEFFDFCVAVEPEPPAGGDQ